MSRSQFLPLFFLLLAVPILRAQEDDEKKKKGASPIPDGLKALQHADPKVRYRAAQTLGDLGPLAKFATLELHEALKDKHALVRVKVAESLWKIEKTPATILLPVLLLALKDKDANARAAAPAVIVLFGAKARSAVPALVVALKDPRFEVKVAAVAALGDLGPVAKDKAGDLLDVTADVDFFLLEPFVGAALANLGEGALPALTTALEDKSADRRRVAAYALGSMGRTAAPAAGDLAKALAGADPAVRTLAARALGKLGDDSRPLLPQLEKALGDKDVSVRIESALATWFITGQAKHVVVLVKALEDDNVNARVNACQALAVMRASAKDAVKPVAKLLHDKDLRVRAIMTLGEIGAPAEKTLPQLKKLLQDKEGDTQLASAFAVWQITGEAKETMIALEHLLGTETHYTPAINTLGAMGPAAERLLPTLINLYREEEVTSDRLALASAIKKIDPKVAMKLGIK